MFTLTRFTRRRHREAVLGTCHFGVGITTHKHRHFFGDLSLTINGPNEYYKLTMSATDAYNLHAWISAHLTTDDDGEFALQPKEVPPDDRVI
jgi:hypothetical protein